MQSRANGTSLHTNKPGIIGIRGGECEQGIEQILFELSKSATGEYWLWVWEVGESDL